MVCVASEDGVRRALEGLGRGGMKWRMGAKVGGKRRGGSVEMHGLFASCLALWVRIPQSDATTATTLPLQRLSHEIATRR